MNNIYDKTLPVIKVTFIDNCTLYFEDGSRTLFDEIGLAAALEFNLTEDQRAKVRSKFEKARTKCSVDRIYRGCMTKLAVELATNYAKGVDDIADLHDDIFTKKMNLDGTGATSEAFLNAVDRIRTQTINNSNILQELGILVTNLTPAEPHRSGE